jgi:hypothetical protein
MPTKSQQKKMQRRRAKRGRKAISREEKLCSVQDLLDKLDDSAYLDISECPLRSAAGARASCCKMCDGLSVLFELDVCWEPHDLEAATQVMVYNGETGSMMSSHEFKQCSACTQ